MPELPEVEVTRMGIAPYLEGELIQDIVVRIDKLRWPVSDELLLLKGQVIRSITRRAKYLLIHTTVGDAVVHLGMSGSLRILLHNQPPAKHDHIDLIMNNGIVLRYNDPRRFGAWLWQNIDDQQAHSYSLLASLGPEPLSKAFNYDYLVQQVNNRKIPVKQFIMDNKVVVGVGNIYANEALFHSHILPTRPTNSINGQEWIRLVDNIKRVLQLAIEQGGTTLKDFTQSDGRPGYFAQQLQVYGRSGDHCPNCGAIIQQQKIAQRNSFFCLNCQF